MVKYCFKATIVQIDSNTFEARLEPLSVNKYSGGPYRNTQWLRTASANTVQVVCLRGIARVRFVN